MYFCFNEGRNFEMASENVFETCDYKLTNFGEAPQNLSVLVGLTKFGEPPLTNLSGEPHQNLSACIHWFQGIFSRPFQFFCLLFLALYLDIQLFVSQYFEMLGLQLYHRIPAIHSSFLPRQQLQ